MNGFSPVNARPKIIPTNTKNAVSPGMLLRFITGQKPCMYVKFSRRDLRTAEISERINSANAMNDHING